MLILSITYADFCRDVQPCAKHVKSDLKSADLNGSWGFESPSRHQLYYCIQLFTRTKRLATGFCVALCSASAALLPEPRH